MLPGGILFQTSGVSSHVFESRTGTRHPPPSNGVWVVTSQPTQLQQIQGFCLSITCPQELKYKGYQTLEAGKKTFPNPAQKFWEFATAFKTHSSSDFTRTDYFLDLFSLISLSLEVKSSSRVKILYHCNLVTSIYTICPKFSHYSCHSQLFTGSGTCSFRGNLQITTKWCAANCRQWALEQNWAAA